jgi:hypothetical protein
MAQAGDNKKLIKDSNDKIKAYQAKYEEITNITGFAKETKRMSVPKGKK